MTFSDYDLNRFFSKVIYNDTSCWEWTACKNIKGYGQFSFNKKHISAHRFSYLYFRGELQPHLLICHHCDNPGCVNPFHLFQGTHKENMQDAGNKKRLAAQNGRHRNTIKTHCNRGHSFNTKNTIRTTSNRRVCRICRDAHNSLRHLENRDKTIEEILNGSSK